MFDLVRFVSHYNLTTMPLIKYSLILSSNYNCINTMKRALLQFLIASILLCQYTFSQSMYVYQGSQVTEFKIADMDSITFSQAGNSPVVEPTMYVGGDISMLPKYEQHGNTYYDINGKKVDVLPFFSQLGLNSMRVRLFVDPTKATAENIGSGVVQDLNFVVNLSKQIKKAGFKLMLDFHYSDSWADPAQQTIPYSWRNASAQALTDTLYNYTKRCLKVMNENGVTPDFIQIGNEISYGMLWNTGKVYATSDNNWNVFSAFLKSASKACREMCPNAKIIIHTERSGNATVSRQYYEKIKSYGVDYDIIGLSYYPFWHNDLATLNTTLSTLENSFPDKKIQIVETAYYYQWLPKVDYDFSSTWSVSPEGQKKFLSDLISMLKRHSNVNGLYWWFPEENGNGVIDNWVNRGLFDDNNGKALPALYILGDFAK